jgi:two-component system chemotaxis sensor kinase CheA
MNEFIEQFIVESRELVEQASAGLTALERSPQDPAPIDATFRAIHTLKGGAAIVDFFAMERAVHAVESALSAARSGEFVLTATMIGDCFACLDQVSRWLNTMEQSGELPADADAQADKFVARVTAAAGHAGADAPGTNWFADVTKRSEHTQSQAMSVVRYTPPSDSFFKGEDPLALIASMPGLLSMDLEPVDQLPTLDLFDPFECIFIVTAMSTASANELSAHFRDHLAECEIRSFAATVGESESILSEIARKVLQAQMDLLGEAQSATFAGRVASSGLVAANVLRHCSQDANAEVVSRATAQSLGEKNVRYLLDAIAGILAPARMSAPQAAIELPERTLPETITRSLRVDAERVDALVRLTGELTVVKNAIGHVLKLAEANAYVHAPNAMASALTGPHRDFDHLIGELQRAVLGIRVLPMRTVLQRFPRLVREISTALDKPVKLFIEGDDAEADKAIIEMLFEPLLHIVRNAMDHGIEVSAVRRERGKPAVGTLHIRASRQGSHVVVEVEDDGGGVDVTRVRAVAGERGIATAESLEAMSEEHIIDLIFAPGFSTASRVTGLSGRGVGMDAVRTAVERVGGRVTMASRSGLGSTVKLLLPFSVILTHVMTVEAGDQIFGIPLDAVVETVSIPTAHIMGVGTARAFVHRSRTLPVFELADLLQMRERYQMGGEAVIVVAAVGGHLGGLHVDRLGDRMEVMLKPLDGLLTGMRGIAGTAILGDGRVLLVLDLAEVMQ